MKILLGVLVRKSTKAIRALIRGEELRIKTALATVVFLIARTKKKLLVPINRALSKIGLNSCW